MSKNSQPTIRNTDVINVREPFRTAAQNPKAEGTKAAAKFAALQGFHGKTVGDFLAFGKENKVGGESAWARGELLWCLNPHRNAPNGYVELQPGKAA